MPKILSYSSVFLCNICNFLFILKIVEKAAHSEPSFSVNIVDEKLITYLTCRKDSELIQLKAMIDLMGYMKYFLFIFDLIEIKVKKSHGFNHILNKDYLQKNIECALSILVGLSQIIDIESVNNYDAY